MQLAFELVPISVLISAIFSFEISTDYLQFRPAALGESADHIGAGLIHHGPHLLVAARRPERDIDDEAKGAFGGVRHRFGRIEADAAA